MTTTVDPRGSVPLPADVLRDGDAHPGDEVEVLAEDRNSTLRKPGHLLPESLLDILRGLKGRPIPELGRSFARDADRVA